MKIHIYHHFDDDLKHDRIIELLRRVLDKLDMQSEDPTGSIKQGIMDKLNAIIEDVKKTIS